MYILAGAFSLTEDYKSRPTFLIPYFRSMSSNNLFVQDLDRDHIITRFCYFEPYKYQIIHFDFAHIYKNKGDIGIMTYFTPRKGVIIDDANVIKHKLSHNELEYESEPFFDLDRGYLLRNTGVIECAIEKSSRFFTSPMHSDSWSGIENASAHKLKQYNNSGIISFDEFIKELQDVGENKWYYTWLKYYEFASDRTNFLRLTLDYIKNNEINSSTFRNIVSKIMDELLNNPEKIEGDSFFIYAEVNQCALIWLKSELTNLKSSANWERLWLQHASFYDESDEDLLQIGIDYLSITLHQKNLYTQKRATIWKTIWDGRFYRANLIKIARESLSGSGHKSSFLGSFILDLRKTRNVECIKIVLDWTLSTKDRSIIWINAIEDVLTTLRSSKNMQILESDLFKLYNLVVHWLESGKTNYNNWTNIYKLANGSLFEKIENKRINMGDIAKKWILNANSSLPSWPNFALNYLMESPRDIYVADLLQAWLDKNQSHRLALPIAGLLNETSTLRSDK
ncbi:hypothetical protein ABZT49_00875 [Methylobacterium sp. EM32]|uniref:hypothetical protein n=1 Tax=Methylobacterium sp. EM32 TaxID=3163481 RepID=UPI0033B87DCD